VPVELPIDEVMVFSDRARVIRRGPAKGSGLRTLRLPDLPGALVPGSVRVSVAQGKVVRVELSPIERERFGIDQVDAWLVQLEEAADELAVVQGTLAAVQRELALVSNLTVSAPLGEKDREGKALVPAASSWQQAQERLAQRRAALRKKEQALEDEQRPIAARVRALQQEIQARNLGGFEETKTQAVVILDGGSALEVEYTVPGAWWKPLYELSFSPDDKRVSLAVAGSVTQASGEEWRDVKLRLSTAIPGQDIALPTLLTWTLGDDREFVPTPTARSMPVPLTAPSFAYPQPPIAELEKEADRELLARRLDQLMAMATQGPRIEALSGGQPSSRTSTSTAPSMASMAPPEPPMPMEADAFVDEAPVAYDVEGAPPSAKREAVFAEEATPRKRSSAEPSTRRRGGGQRFAMRSGKNWSRPTFGDSFLPAVSAGGFDFVYDAPLRTTVPGDASGLRVPLEVRTAVATTLYEATPALQKTAFLKARVDNGATLPLLAGPATIFVKGTYSGEAQLPTTGPGGTIELPLGADEDIQLTRTVVPQTSSQGFLVGQQDLTDYAVTIEVGNYKKVPITLRLVDVLPKTAVDKIEVKLLSSTPTLREPQDGDGLIAWVVDVPAGGTKKVSFTYRITRPKGWRLSP
jgi:chaperonin cofactor prefoldin